MKHKPAIYALERLHAELGGKIKDNRTEAAQLVADMKHVEATLRMLEPGFDVRRIAARRKNRENQFFKRGTIFRSVQGILREAAGPMTTRQLVEMLFRQKGIEKPHLADVRSLVGAVHSSLKNHQGKTVEAVGEGMPVKWRLKGDTASA